MGVLACSCVFEAAIVSHLTLCLCPQVRPPDAHWAVWRRAGGGRQRGGIRGLPGLDRVPGSSQRRCVLRYTDISVMGFGKKLTV